MMRPARITARLRLTLLFLGLFVGLGAVLLTLNYQLVASGLPKADEVVVQGTLNAAGGGPTPITVAGVPSVPSEPSSVRPPASVTGYDEIEAALTETARRSIGTFRKRTLADLVRKSALALGITAIVAVVLSWLAAGRVLRPLHTITATARRLNDDNLHERLQLSGPHDELRELADTFNGMLDRLEASFAAERRLIANASHELRTPVAIQRTLLEVALREPDASVSDLRRMGEQVLVQTDRHERLLRRMLLLSHAGNAELESDDIVPSELVDRALHGNHRDDLDISTRLDRTLVVRGDPQLTEVVVTNLVVNAITHNVPGGFVTVCVGSDRDGHVELVVENSGPKVAPDQVTLLLEPFRRGAQNRTGSTGSVGLGLALVTTIVHRHDWKLDIATRSQGGLRTTVTFGT